MRYNLSLYMTIFKNLLTAKEPLTYTSVLFLGAIAQLGERLHGMQEVGGSIPPSSTIDHYGFLGSICPDLSVV